MIQNEGQIELEYLKLADSFHLFIFFILKKIIEDRQTTHVERINNARNLIVLQASDIVMTWTVIQSNLSKKKVTKLCYAVRDPYQNYPQHW